MKKTITTLLSLCTFMLMFTACNMSDPPIETDTAPTDTQLDSLPATPSTDTIPPETIAPATEADTTPIETEAPKKELFYVRTPAQPPERTEITYPVYEFESYEEAVAKANNPYLGATGYAVYSESGEFLYGINNEYVTNMMFRAKYVVDFAKANDYKYGSAAKNPAQTFRFYLKYGRLREKIVSCDRYVGWVLYEMGYTDQPEDAGMFVWANANSSEHNLMVFLEKHNYERIDNTTDFKAGDIVFVRPTTSSGGSPYGAHVFICAGSLGRGNLFFRYDHGSDTRIQSDQPSKETITELFCVYRPTQTTLEDMPAEP